MIHGKTANGNEYGVISAKRAEHDFARENLRSGRFFAYGAEGYVAQARTLASALRALDRAACRGYTQLHVYEVT
jgi:hypothetical protein